MVVTSAATSAIASWLIVRMPCATARARSSWGGGAGHDQLADLVGHGQHLVHADTVAVPGVGAVVAADAVDERVLRRAAEEVVQLALLARRFVRRRRTTGRSCGPVVARRHRRATRPSGTARCPCRSGGRAPRSRRWRGCDDITTWPVKRRLHGDARRLLVADLADEDDVGVLAEDRLQTAGERDVGLQVDLHLVDRRGRRTRPGPRSSSRSARCGVISASVA